MNCGRSSSVEWKLPKLQRRVRFPSPAPPPPGYAPGGFVVRDRHAWPATHSSTFHSRPHAALWARTRYKTPPARGPRGPNRYKTPPAPPKWPISARFTPAGRTLYRLRHQQAEQGELYTARRANSGTKLSPHTPQRAIPVQNSPSKRPWQAHPVQNSPSEPQNADFGPFCASRENFVPLSPPTRRAGRNKSRTNTPPHPPMHPSPNFACNSIA